MSRRTDSSVPSLLSVRLTKCWAKQLTERLGMAYQVPKSKASIKQNRFEFSIDGKTYSVPLLKYLSGNKIEEIAAAEDKGGMASIVVSFSIFGDKGTPAGDAVRTLDQDQLGELNDAYMKASGISVGESEASTDSSESTERPSDSTSSPEG